MLLNNESSSSGKTSSDEIESFVQHIAREYFLDGIDRRSEPRYRLTIQVRVQPVDEYENVIGAAVRAVTRDLSVGGIGLNCQDPLNGKLIVQLESPSGTKLRTLAEVLRCEPIGYYFDVGCRFLCEAQTDR